MVKSITLLAVLSSIIVISINPVQGQEECEASVIEECNSAWEGYSGKTCEYVCSLCSSCVGIFRDLVPDCKYCPEGDDKKDCVSTCTKGSEICRECGLL